MWIYGTITYQHYLIIVSLIIYLLIRNFIYTPFVRHSLQMNGEIKLRKKCCKNTLIDKKHPMFYFECVILFIHITKQSPVKFFSAPKRRKSGVKILKLIKHPMSCFEYIILFILITKQSPVKLLVHQNGESPKSKWSLFGQNVVT